MESVLEEMVKRDEFYKRTQIKRHKEVLSVVRSLVSPPANVLDISTLFGNIACNLFDMGYNVVATDIQEEVERYREQIEKRGVIEFVCDLNTDQLPFKDNFFDCVIMSEVIEHLQTSSVVKALSEAIRVLKVGGFLVISTPNLYNIGARLRLLFGYQPLPKEHVRQYSITEVHKMIKGIELVLASGGIPFNAIKTATNNTEIFKEWYSLCSDVIARLFLLPIKFIYPRFRTTMFTVVRKV